MTAAVNYSEVTKRLWFHSKMAEDLNIPSSVKWSSLVTDKNLKNLGLRKFVSEKSEC